MSIPVLSAISDIDIELVLNIFEVFMKFFVSFLSIKMKFFFKKLRFCSVNEFFVKLVFYFNEVFL